MDDFMKKQALLATKIEKSFTKFKKLGQAKMTLGTKLTRKSNVDQLWKEMKANVKHCLETGLADTTHAFFMPEGLYEQYEEKYLEVIAEFKDHQLTLERPGDDDHGYLDRSMSVAEPTLAKLAPITIPKFGGDPQEWSRFRDMFKTTVVDSTAYQDSLKLHYLKAHLTGEALLTIEGIPLDGRNFGTAWKTLKNNYDNQRRMVDAHMKFLFSINPMSKESSMELRTHLTGTKNTVLALKTFDRPTDQWDDFLVYLTINKTDKETRRQWEMSRGNDRNPPTFEALTKFLQARVQTLAALEGMADIKLPQATKKENSKETKPQSFSSSTSQPKEGKTKSFHSAKQKAPPKCLNCKLPHWIDKCAEFLNKTVNERRAFAKIFTWVSIV